MLTSLKYINFLTLCATVLDGKKLGGFFCSIRKVSKVVSFVQYVKLTIQLLIVQKRGGFFCSIRQVSIKPAKKCYTKNHDIDEIKKCTYFEWLVGRLEQRPSQLPQIPKQLNGQEFLQPVQIHIRKEALLHEVLKMNIRQLKK